MVGLFLMKHDFVLAADFEMSLQSLSNSLEECKAKYFNLGIQLGLDFNVIKEFESYSGDCSLCLSTLLNKYMANMSPDVEEVCQAVKKVGRNDIAEDLRKRKYKGWDLESMLQTISATDV